MPYVALINTPGYMPDSDEPPPTFDTIVDAWEYVISEIEQGSEGDLISQSSATIDEILYLKAYSGGQGCCGTVIGPTPGYDGDHDLGVAYTVTEAEE